MTNESEKGLKTTNEMKKRLTELLKAYTIHSNGLVSADELTAAILADGWIRRPKFKNPQYVYFYAIRTNELKCNTVSKIIWVGDNDGCFRYEIDGEDNKYYGYFEEELFATELEALKAVNHDR